jgi:aryl sulfotransferase
VSGRTVWLASYPKSGNTWVRAIVTALSTHPHLFGVNQLGAGNQPFGLGASLHRFGLDSRWLTVAEGDRLRASLVAGPAVTPVPGEGGGTTPPRLRKTHEVYRPGSRGAEPFPTKATRAAVLIVRDPRDVACSYAPFFGRDLDGAIEAMGRDGGGPASSATCRTSEPWGTWSSHARSWLDPDGPFPVHHVRAEALRDDAAATLAPVFAAIGLACTPDELAAAVDQARFERLARSETERGFRETSPKTPRFFRAGQTGGWRRTLTADQVAAIEADHADLMARLGYPLSSS